ncbi:MULTISPECIES: alpha/beta fold hydrolase [Kitasatospora]|uniref:alpha/beta fold hydrolase n=1 Tax=Kitasatospora TaxID=2063 RepID=UPI000C703FFA|nr:alpha/beta hydrolase [Kitasatospora sp. GP30]MDH6140828.1 pimeloyl-ACP methyl ester carboxylesterase [Kitasatospora sp. GP30]
MTEGGGGNGVGRAGLIGLGVLAAGAAAGVAIERLTLGRARRRARQELDAAAPFGSLRGRPRKVAAADGTELYVEVDEPDEVVPGAPTVVFCHGYCLNQDSFHFQRAALRGGLRLVFWDQRSHGRSDRSRSYLAGRPADIDQLGGDLKTVLDAVVPTGPIVLVGHSMGGMTVMALAEQHPELFAPSDHGGRVVAVALIGTTAGDWDSIDLGLSSAGMKVWRRVGPGVVKLLGSQVGLVEATRRAGADIAAVFYRRFSFGNGGKDVDPGIARFAEQLLDSTPIDVVAEFYPVFSAHDKAGALAALPPLPVLVLAGTDDLLTPASHSAAIARTLPGAELELLPGAGHLVLLERSDEVDRQLARLLCRTGLPLPERVRELAADQP